MPSSVLAVAGQALRAARADAGPGGMASSRVLTRSGRWVVLHGAAMDAAHRRVAIIIEPAHPARIAPLLMSAFGLSEREEDVTRLVLQGQTTDAISRQLTISPHTVQEHLKSIFDKASVRSRRELVGKIFLMHYEPRLRDNERRRAQERLCVVGPSTRTDRVRGVSRPTRGRGRSGSRWPSRERAWSASPPRSGRASRCADAR